MGDDQNASGANGSSKIRATADPFAATEDELDWHDVSLILSLLELSPLERIRRGEEQARQMLAFRDAVADQL